MSNNIKEIPESPEAVTYKLMQDVLKAEAKAFSDLNPRNKRWYLEYLQGSPEEVSKNTSYLEVTTEFGTSGFVVSAESGVNSLKMVTCSTDWFVLL